MVDLIDIVLAVRTVMNPMMLTGLGLTAAGGTLHAAVISPVNGEN